MKRVFSLLMVLWMGTLFAYYPINEPLVYPKNRILSTQSPQGKVSDEPCDWWYYWWTGVGDLTYWGVSNTGQGPIFVPRGLPELPPYDGSITQQYTYQARIGLDRGWNGVYPAGSAQPYTFAAGGWIGALYPVVIGKDTAWDTVVAKCAYYSDLGAMKVPEMENAGEVGDISGAGLYFSDMVIPEGFPHAGEYLFKQPGFDKEDYQALWPFADTSINKRRPGAKLDPAKGDIVSNQDTYAVCGDWISADDARVIWANPGGGPYQGRGMGIRVEVRTYSWNYDYNRDYLYINYKIRNMNDFPLRKLYLGYFMDNDIGDNPRPQGAWDDMIGFDKELNLGYTYDADAFEPGWKSPAGYIGCVLVETPEDIGLTGFLTWPNDPNLSIDHDTADGAKYEMMARKEFMTWVTPQDVRQLSASGPIEELKPGEEISFTVAIVAAPTLPELKAKARNAINQFETGYLGFAPPYSPIFTLRPGDGRVYISWDDRAEDYVDRMSGQKTFEGYRVYRSRTGLTGEWELLADYDLKGSYTKDTVVTKYLSGTSKATISFEGFEPEVAEGVYGDNQYTISFTDSVVRVDTTLDSTMVDDTLVVDTIIDPVAADYIVYNLTKQELYSYNPDAIKDGYGYFVIDKATNEPYPEKPGYHSGDKIYIDGFYVRIEDGKYDPAQPGADSTVNPKDVFVIKSYKAKPIGSQVGISHYLVDSTVTNGVTYYYTVTSYSRELPEYGVGSLESGKKKKWVIPRKEPMDMRQAGVDTISHPKGSGNALVKVVVVNPDEITGDEYRINFYPEKGDTIRYWRLTDVKRNKVLLDSITALSGERSVPVVDGLGISIDAVLVNGVDTEAVYDTMKSGWIKYDSIRKGWVKGKPNYGFLFKPDTGGLKYLSHDYEILFTPEGGKDVYGHSTPFEVRDSTLRKPAIFVYTDVAPKGEFSKGDIIKLYHRVDEKGLPRDHMLDMTVMVDTLLTPVPPKVGDFYYLKTLKAVTSDDEFVIKTTRSERLPSREVSLDSVRVVPNPYYIRAIWDESRVKQRIYFQGLPTDTTCTIRIFNAAGLLIREIKPEECNLGGGAKYWDLYTNEKLRAVSGLYIYQVVTKDGKSKVGKFVIIR